MTWRSASLSAGLFLSLCVLQGCKPGPSIDAPGAPAELMSFITQVLTLHGQGESALPALLDCFEWTDVTPQTRQAVERSLQYDMDTPIQRARVVQWNPPVHRNRFFAGDICPNLEPDWILHLFYTSTPPHELSLPIGRNPQGHYRIINPVPCP